jgi:hypothetical protein
MDPVTNQQSVPLPFGFKLYADTFTSVNVGCRGYLAFAGGSATKAQSMGIPSTAAAYPIVAPWWGSWECQPGAVSYAISGVVPQRVMTFQWDRVWYTPDTAGKSAHGVTFQVKLYETSHRIEFSYGPTSMDAYEPPDASKAPKAAVGIQGAGGKVGLPGSTARASRCRRPWATPASTHPSGAQCAVADYTPDQLITPTRRGPT